LDGVEFEAGSLDALRSARAIPLTAILGSWLEGHLVTVLGIADVGSWTTQASSMGQVIVELRTTLGNVVWIAGVHAAAASFHHFVPRDRVLLSMLLRGAIRAQTTRTDSGLSA
jgi:cytochrome b561